MKAADADETGVGRVPLIVRFITDIRTPKTPSDEMR